MDSTYSIKELHNYIDESKFNLNVARVYSRTYKLYFEECSHKTK